ncbi:MAG: hypothetical protein AAF492_30250, partial [Verrucomicrobiota bacterium]
SAWQLAGEKAMLTGTNLLIYKDSGQFDRLPPSELFRRYYVVGSTADNDEDYVSDAQEIFIHKTDPDDPSSCPTNISGDIAYTNWQGESIRVVAVTSPDAWSSPYVTTLSAPGAYQFCGLPLDEDYWIKAHIDSNGNGLADPCEPWGLYSNLAVHLTAETNGLDLTLFDSLLPNLIVPPDQTVDCEESIAPEMTGTATLDGSPLPAGAFSVFSSDQFLTGCPPQVVRTWTLDDGCSNSVSADQVITIQISNSPAIRMPPDITIDCVESLEPWNTGEAFADYAGVPESTSNVVDFTAVTVDEGALLPAVNGVDLLISGAILIQPGGSTNAYDGDDSGWEVGGIDDAGTGNAIAPSVHGEKVTLTFGRPIQDLQFT